MADLQQARRLINEANPNAAREIVQQLLRENVYDVEAWRLAVMLARTDEERSHAEEQLNRALQHQQIRAQSSRLPSVPQAQPISATPIYTKDYMGEALLTLLLYYLGFGLFGIIANVLFLNGARDKQASGIPVKNVGCLQWLLWIHLGLIALGTLFFCVFALVPLVFAGIGAAAGVQ